MQQKNTSCNRTIVLTKPWLHYTVIDKDDKHVQIRESINIYVMYIIVTLQFPGDFFLTV